MTAPQSVPETLPASLNAHRVRPSGAGAMTIGQVRWAPAKSLWFTAMAAAGVAGGVLTFAWDAFALFLATTAAVLLLGVSLGSHRKLAHDSFQCPRALEYLLVWLGVQAGLGGPIALVRRHELRDYGQRLPDCHPYLRHGAGLARDAWWQLHCELHLRDAPFVRIESRIAGDPFYRFLERTWVWQHLPVALALYAWGGWGFVFWGSCARVAACISGQWLVGWFAHNEGPMHYEVRGAAVQGRNVPWAALVSMGECWHNNHHAYPGSAKLGLYPGEWDPGWWTLRGLALVGLASGLRTPEDLPKRSELANIDYCELPTPAAQFASD